MGNETKEVKFDFCIFSQDTDMTSSQADELWALINTWAESNSIFVGGGYADPEGGDVK